MNLATGAWRHPQKNLIGLAVMALLLSWFCAPSRVLGQGDPELRGRLEGKRSELREQRKREEILNERERDLSRQLNEAQANLEDMRVAYEDTLVRLDSATLRLEQLQTRVQEATKEYKHSQATLGKRLREIYLEGDVGYLVVLLGASSFTDFLDHTYYLRLVVENDKNLMEKVRSLKEELESQAKAAKQTVEEIRDLKASQEDRLVTLENIESRRAALLDDVQSQRRSVSSYVAELEGSTAELEGRLRSMAAKTQTYLPPTSSGGGSSRSWGTGAYVTPADGPITSPYGYRVHPIFGTLRFHSGIDIGAYYGSPILAADSGVVIEAGWIGGYGNTVMIDHGNGYSTLYGHCSSLHVNVGQNVAKGQQIASVGSTGNSTGPHLHFEVRINGNPVDPLGFI